MKKRFGLTVVVGLIASVASLRAAACVPVTTVSALVALGSGGCTVDDKLFSNFTYTPGAGAPAASLVNADLLAAAVFPGATFGWDFAPATGAFLGNFALSFTATVIPDPTCPAVCRITDTESQMFPGTTPGPSSTQAFSIAVSAGPSPVLLNNLSFGGNSNGSVISPGVTSLTETVTSSGITSSTPVLDLSLRVSESVVPEPATLVLTGAGLLGLGLFGRRKSI